MQKKISLSFAQECRYLAPDLRGSASNATTLEKTPNPRAPGVRSRESQQKASGQAMLSYSLITLVLITGTLIGGAWFMPKLLDSMNRYTGGLYFTLNLPFP